MTIGVGILASDGIVIAADSQATGDIKTWRGKVRATYSRKLDNGPDGTIAFSHQGGCLISISGYPAGPALRAAGLLIRVFDQNRELIGDDLRLAFENELSRFYADHIFPLNGLPQNERPSIELLIGVSRDDRDDLWYSDGTILLPAGPYHVIGSGQTQADPLIGHLYQLPRPSLIQSLFMAAFIVHQAKEVNPHCGKTTDIFCLRNNLFYSVRRSIAIEIDRLFSEHQSVLVSAGLWGAMSMLRPKDKAAIAKTRRRLKTFEESIRRKDLFEKPTGKPPRPSR